MSTTVDGLTAELKVVRKGRGLRGIDVHDVGPNLRELCGVLAEDSPPVVRDKLARRLTASADGLPADLRLAVLAALSLIPEVDSPFLNERVQWLSGQFQRDSRTVRRKIDQGITALAEAAASGMASTALPGGTVNARWHTRHLRAAVVVGAPRIESFEARRVHVSEDGLDELDLAMTVPAPASLSGTASPADLGVDVLFGGRLVAKHMESADRFGFHLRLPRPLRAGEEHEFALRIKPAPHWEVEPHYVCVPKYPCDRFQLSVRFAAGTMPQAVHLLAGVFQRDVDDTGPVVGEAVRPDAVGEVHAQFRDLTPGLAYGLRWSP
ncbi:hypothetical protein GCM10010174_25490 [Kutzneria viridogrisea]|uniref:Uncharacterized protein n=2 Tax=Kutzneria TaxID=43356 RepID=W5W587_9PSEU|nr:hypothetical protein [Kutzneria albida]AHH95935.1 hypothetical protein KALB_2567 [Kutzneria albida DSM 43870]MBA8928865.1 hypothetical protein [Kutzneria viridogrisea]